MARKTRNLLTAKLKRALITCFEEFKKHDELQPKQLSTVSSFRFFLILANTLKVACKRWWIFDFETDYTTG
jgi:hypothetical protein